ncbi:MAG: hypothetical protein V4507_05820 [Verrucomicrobiota bacterium]
MRFFIVFWMFSILAFAIEGRGLDQKKDPQPTIESSESSAPAATAAPTEEIRKADLWKGPVNPDFKITKIHEVNTEKQLHAHGNAPLEFERKYWMYGAVTQEQIDARKGQYFVISWANKGAVRNVEARLEYRQSKTKDIVRTLSLHYPSAGGTNRSQFSVLGKAYQEGGEIQSWRFTLWSGDELLAETKSFIW